MSPTRLRECLAALHWSQRGLAALLQVNETRVRRWATGVLPVPPEAAAWLETLAAVHTTHPLPDGWRLTNF